MKWVTHQIFSAACMTAAFRLGLTDCTWLGYAVAGLGSILPDIDYYRADAQRSQSMLNALAHHMAGHRGFFHSLVFWAGISGLAYLVNITVAAPYLPHQVWLAFSIGVASHLLGDMVIGLGGIALLWPRPEKIGLRYSARPNAITWELLRVGGFGETLIFIGCIWFIWANLGR